MADSADVYAARDARKAKEAETEALMAQNAASADAKAAKKARAAALKAERAAARAAKKAAKAGGATKDVGDGAEGVAAAVDDLSISGDATGLTEGQRVVAAVRAVTGVLASAKTSQDVAIEAFTLSVAGNQLVQDTRIELNQGCRYGIIGSNGSGKSNVLAAIAQREVPLPGHIDCFLLHEEAPGTEQTAVEAVIAHVRDEAKRLEDLNESIIEESGPEDERLDAIANRLDELDLTGAEPRARKILSGLGFNDAIVPMDRQTKKMSGGWRMRVSLAKALFAAPSLLLLDEPTNHLDLEACVWLEDHLSRYSKCLMVISHSQDFLNAVCTHTVWLNNRLLKYYGGNYNTFVRQVDADAKVQRKLYEKQKADMEKLETFVRVNRANGVATSAKSKKKVLEKVEAEAVEKPVELQQTLTFRFQDCTKIPPPVLPFSDVSFAYSGKAEDYLYEDLELGVDCDSRVALVGPNGCGKSTLLKLMTGELLPTSGTVTRHPHLVLGKYHQHSADVLDPSLSVLAFMKKQFPPSKVKRSDELWRSYLTGFGFDTRQQDTEIAKLSDGQKSRIVFAMIAMKANNLLLLDEPTNHLDTDAIDGLADAINAFDGGVVLVSHDFRLIDKVAQEIWVCEDKSVKRYDGTIHEYKAKLAKRLKLQRI